MLPQPGASRPGSRQPLPGSSGFPRVSWQFIANPDPPATTPPAAHPQNPKGPTLDIPPIHLFRHISPESRLSLLHQVGFLQLAAGGFVRHKRNTATARCLLRFRGFVAIVELCSEVFWQNLLAGLVFRDLTPLGCIESSKAYVVLRNPYPIAVGHICLAIDHFGPWLPLGPDQQVVRYRLLQPPRRVRVLLQLRTTTLIARIPYAQRVPCHPGGRLVPQCQR